MNAPFKFITALVAAAEVLMVLPTTSKALDNTYYGTGALQSGTSKASYDSAFGFDALFHNTTGAYNTGIGVNALVNDTTGNFNTATGVNTLQSDTTGGSNTADGEAALSSNTTGGANTAIGSQALHLNTTGTGNVAEGYQALYSNTNGEENTATGVYALYGNTNGSFNTACGYDALLDNTSGTGNTGLGIASLELNTSGFYNTAIGNVALYSNVTGAENAAIGVYALYKNATGGENTASGFEALYSNSNGSYNTANGGGALSANTTGINNIAIGYLAGSNITSGSNNIDIGDVSGMFGADDAPGESDVIRIGDTKGPTQTACYIAGIENDKISGGAAVYITTGGQLGVETSSRQYKQDIKEMGDSSDVLLSLKPVSFKYKPEIDPKGLPQYGLVAEDVEKACPGLVVHDKDGKPYTVRYQAVNAMLLNEFLKEHEKVSKLETAYAQQQQQISTLTATLKEQASLLQKVNAQLQLMKPGPQVVLNN